MQGIIYEETSVLFFFFVTVVLGGAGAWMTGRACAMTWRPYLTLFFYLLVLGVGVRFIHFSIFEGTLLSLHYYLVDTIVLMIIGFLGYQYTRTNQMVSQYYWLYDRSGWIGWRPKA
jgi:small-conductance mechanosensitive channel